MTEVPLLYARTFATPFGLMVVVVTGEGRVQRLEFVGEQPIGLLLAGMSGLHAATIQFDLPGHAARAATAVEQQVIDYGGGRRRTFEVGLALIGTPFQRRVWAELGRIPYGETRSYGELATRLGRPGAARAVGRANATNPVCLVVPCHRLIGKDGALTGFLGGVELKRRLLELERRHRGR